MDFKEFLENETINEDLIVEKVTKEMNSILKPYTKKVCDALISYDINPQSSETSFVKLDDSVVDEIISGNTEPLNGCRRFIASVNNGDRCVLAVIFSHYYYFSQINVDKIFGIGLNCCGEDELCRSKKVFSEISQKGKVSIFKVTTSSEESERIRMKSLNRESKHFDDKYNDPEKIRQYKKRDLNNYKINKQIGKYGDKIKDIVANVIEVVLNKPYSDFNTDDYKKIISDIGSVQYALACMIEHPSSNSKYTSDGKFYDCLDHLERKSRLNESIPNDVRKIINMCSRHKNLYRSLLAVGIAAENADYTILDNETDKFNKSPKFEFCDYEHISNFKKNPSDLASYLARINIVKRLLEKYDALLLARDRGYAIITLKNGKVNCEGQGSLFANKINAIVGISGGSLKEIKLKKNLLSLVNELFDILDHIDYNKALFFGKHDEFKNAFKLCELIARTCNSLIDSY